MAVVGRGRLITTASLPGTKWHTIWCLYPATAACDTVASHNARDAASSAYAAPPPDQYVLPGIRGAYILAVAMASFAFDPVRGSFDLRTSVCAMVCASHLSI
jgi:hypothetical protein